MTGGAGAAGAGAAGAGAAGAGAPTAGGAGKKPPQVAGELVAVAGVLCAWETMEPNSSLFLARIAP